MCSHLGPAKGTQRAGVGQQSLLSCISGLSDPPPGSHRSPRPPTLVKNQRHGSSKGHLESPGQSPARPGHLLPPSPLLMPDSHPRVTWFFIGLVRARGGVGALSLGSLRMDGTEEGSG